TSTRTSPPLGVSARMVPMASIIPVNMTNSCFEKNRALQIERDAARARTAHVKVSRSLSSGLTGQESLITVGPGIAPGLLTLPRYIASARGLNVDRSYCAHVMLRCNPPRNAHLP